jgi:hypothetical protein
MTAIEPNSPALAATAAVDRRHFASSAVVQGTPEAVFERLDDQTRLAAHMQKSSIMMGGGSMAYDFDEGRGQQVGSHIRMKGVAFGQRLEVDEVVTERAPPARKVWRTTGEPSLLVISAYEMGFALAPAPAGSRLEVWIDYAVARRPLWRWLAALLAMAYACWCVRRMVSDAVKAFPTSGN